MKSKIVILGLTALSTVFVAACSRQSEPVAVQAYSVPTSPNDTSPSASYDRVPDHRNFSASRRPIVIREQVISEQQYAEPQYSSRRVATQSAPRNVVTRRSTKNSALIVAGGAGLGAAIGAIAGGGKGAAIGALAGGGGGFVYDRATHKKRVEY